MLNPESIKINPEINRTPSPQGRGSALKQLQKNFRRPSLLFESKIGFTSGPVRRHGRVKVLWSWMASLIDSCLLLGSSSFFVLVFAQVLKAPMSSVFHDLQWMGHSRSALAMIGLILITGSWFYMVLCRVLFGSSIGEWACDLRLGAPKDEEKPQFIFKVIFRASLILGTGLVTLPLWSFLTGKDIAGQICGLRLFSLK